MKKYKVRAGRHIDSSGRMYEKGQVIQSDRPLTQLFPHKFVEVGSEEDQQDAEQEAVATKTKTATKRAPKKKAKSKDEEEEPDPPTMPIGDDSWDD